MCWFTHNVYFIAWLSSRLDLVVFDLDDTLAPVMGAVGAGTETEMHIQDITYMYMHIYVE